MSAPVLARAGLIGAATGLRSQIGLAAVALAGLPERAPRPFAPLAGRPARIGTAVAAAGELVVDKLPTTPSRLAPAGLVPRFVLGGLAAAVLAAVPSPAAPAPARFEIDGWDPEDDWGPRERPAPSAARIGIAAAVGGSAAVGAAFAGAWWRRRSWSHGGPDWPAALLEDALAVALAWTASSGPASGGTGGRAVAAPHVSRPGP